jgi:hypothetical protein
VQETAKQYRLFAAVSELNEKKESDLTSAFVLAFGFASPWLLGGLALAGVPVLIHLLHKRRFVEAPWAAMRFLIEATRKQSRRMRLENLILLVVRTLILLLIVLALARPHFDSSTTVITEEQPTHRIIVIDASFSMQFNDGTPEAGLEEDARPAGTRMARAKLSLKQMLESARRGDAWQVVRIADREPYAVVTQPAFLTDTIAEELNDLVATDGSGNLIATIETVVEMAQQLPEMPRKEVVLVSDLQASMWAPENEPTKKRLAELFGVVAEKAKVSVINVGSPNSINAAVTGLTTDVGVATIEQRVNIQSTLFNFGPSTLPNQVVELLVNGRLVDTKRIDLPSRINQPLDWEYQFKSAGEHRVEVHLQDDSLPVDNRRWLAFPVREELKVLLVDGNPSGDDRKAATFYIRRAIDPSTLDNPFRGTLRPTVITESELPAIKLASFDVVALCNMGLVTDREVGLLEAYLESGGGLVIFPGGQTNIDNYNQRLYDDGKGVLPAKISEAVVAKTDDDVFTFDPKSFTHPIVKAFRGNPGAGLEATMTMKFLKLIPQEDAKTALWFSDGSPAIVERSYGPGRVILAATSIDDQWSTWSIWAPSFVPMMHEVMLHAAAGRWTNKQLEVGNPIVLAFPGHLFDLPVSVQLPDQSSQVLQVAERESVVAALFTETNKAGIYQVDVGSPLNREMLFAVNVNNIESDLVSVSRNELTAVVPQSAEFRTGDEPLVLEGGSKRESNLSTLARVLAWTVLVFLLLEPLLAWRFSVGLAALAFAALVALLAPMLGFPFALVLASGIGAAVLRWRFVRKPT